MRNKIILSLTAFFSAFIFSVLLVGVPKDNFYARSVQWQSYQENRQKIRLLLEQDISNGELRDQTIWDFEDSIKNSKSSFKITSYADATEDYVESSQSIDDSDLPSDFQNAWHAHMDAWREQADYLNQLKASGKKYRMNNQETMQYTLGVNETNIYNNQVGKINQTWSEVLRIGRKYGVYVSDN